MIGGLIGGFKLVGESELIVELLIGGLIGGLVELCDYMD